MVAKLHLPLQISHFFYGAISFLFFQFCLKEFLHKMRKLGMLSSRGNFRYFESNRLGFARTQTSTSLLLQYTITMVILLIASGQKFFPFFLNDKKVLQSSSEWHGALGSTWCTPRVRAASARTD